VEGPFSLKRPVRWRGSSTPIGRGMCPKEAGVALAEHPEVGILVKGERSWPSALAERSSRA